MIATVQPGNSNPEIESLSVKNSFEFVDMIKEITIEVDEMMISFDVEALFPSIPIPEALLALEQYFIKNKVSVEKMNMKAAKLCMEQNIFQFRN